MLEDRFANAGVTSLLATAIALSAWAMAPAPYALQFCALTWLCIAVNVICLTGAWATLMIKRWGGYLWSVIRHNACAHGVHLARSRHIVIGIRECSFCFRRFR